MRNVSCLFVAITVLAVCGCGKKIVPVTGEVLYEDEPAKNIAVLFEPKSDAKEVPFSGIAVTGPDGRFTILTTEKQQKRGLEQGSYTVYLGWKNPDTVEGSDAGPQPGDPPPIPSPYRFPEKIGNGELVVDVRNDGKNHFVFRVTPDNVQWDDIPDR